MSAFYEKLLVTAQRLIQQFGEPVTIRKDTSTVDPIAGPGFDAPSGPWDTFTPSGIVRRYADNLIDGTRILSSDRELIIEAGAGYTPEMGDKPEIDGETWVVVNVTTSKPTSLALVHFLQVRR